MRFTFTHDADGDMDELADYLESLRPLSALRLGTQIQKAIHNLLSFPELGKREERLTKRAGTRVFRFVAGKYLVFYYIADDSIRILGILHGKRDTANIMSDRLE